MDRVEDLKLIKVAYAPDDIGQQVESDTVRTVACSLHGITRQEWTSASQQGLKPQVMCLLRGSDDYADEEVAELSGVRYSIYRTFLRDDGGIELYLRQDTGS
jgi:SPP1 family predicted phage head-tail adaptor